MTLENNHVVQTWLTRQRLTLSPVVGDPGVPGTAKDGETLLLLGPVSRCEAIRIRLTVSSSLPYLTVLLSGEACQDGSQEARRTRRLVLCPKKEIDSITAIPVHRSHWDKIGSTAYCRCDELPFEIAL